jgi:hypothetical protein
VYFNLYIFEYEAGRQNILDCKVACIPWVQSSLISRLVVHIWKCNMKLQISCKEILKCDHHNMVWWLRITQNQKCVWIKHKLPYIITTWPSFQSSWLWQAIYEQCLWGCYIPDTSCFRYEKDHYIRDKKRHIFVCLLYVKLMIKKNVETVCFPTQQTLNINTCLNLCNWGVLW